MGFLDTTGLAHLWSKIKERLNEKVPQTRTINGKALSANVTLKASDIGAVDEGMIGVAGGVAGLDDSGKISATNLPSYVDDVLEYSAKANFPTTGETGKIYVDTTTNLSYRWSGSAYVEISGGIALGETSATAYRGDRGKIAYEHSQQTHAPANAEANVQSDWNDTDTTSDAYIKNKPTSMPANGGNAATVNGHTVGVDVPADAKFTDTVYTLPNASTNVLGGVKIGSNISVNNGVVSVTKDNVVAALGYTPPSTNTTYSAITEAEIDAIFEE